MNGTPDPIVTFYRAIPESFEPMRADRSALGVIPTAAFQYCEALTSASAFGWYAFAPMTFYLQWDGTDVIWSHGDSRHVVSAGLGALSELSASTSTAWRRTTSKDLLRRS